MHRSHLSWIMRPQILWAFEIQTYHLISTSRPDRVVSDKKKTTCQLVDFTVQADESESKWKRKKGWTSSEISYFMEY